MIILLALENLFLIIGQVASDDKISIFYCSWMSPGESWIKEKAMKYRPRSMAAWEQNMHLLHIPKRFLITHGYKFPSSRGFNGKYLFGRLERKDSSITIKSSLIGWFAKAEGELFQNWCLVLQKELQISVPASLCISVGQSTWGHGINTWRCDVWAPHGGTLLWMGILDIQSWAAEGGWTWQGQITLPESPWLVVLVLQSPQ